MRITTINCRSIDGRARLKIHTKYDLKGSTVHRTAGDGDKVLKDNNLRKSRAKFHLGAQREAFLKVWRHEMLSVPLGATEPNGRRRWMAPCDG